MNFTLGVTGHRPNGLPGGYDETHPFYTWLRNEIRNKISQLKPSEIITGMALGVDQIVAEIAIELNIPFVAAVPFEGQESKWPQSSKEKYDQLLRKAEEVVIVSEDGYAAWKMQKRNEWIVDNSDAILGIWSGLKGGTGNCLEYAEKKNKTIHRINPNYWDK